MRDSGMVTIRMAFSWTWYRHINEHIITYNEAGRKILGFGRNHTLYRIGSIHNRAKMAQCDGFTVGRVLVSYSPTNPLVT